MLNQHHDILNRALDWLAHGHEVLLYTVVNSWGSSPRPPGSIMVLRDDGHVSGSVSGGCIEDDLIDRIHQQTSLPETPVIIRYGNDWDDARPIGFPCGGSLRLIQEKLDKTGLGQLLGMLDQGQIVRRVVDLDNGKVTLEAADQTAVMSCDDQRFVSLFGPRYRLLIIGAVQIAELLAQIAISLDYAVTVCDPREEYHAQWSVEGTTLVRTMPDDAVESMQVDRRAAIVALTHDPKLDDLALIEALSSPAFYVGALGSKANSVNRRQRLKEFDLSDAQIARLKCPVGLDIGSKTPAEIAVSIAAELIAARSGK